VTIRHIPDDVRDELAARAARALITVDRRLANAPGIDCRVEVPDLPD